MAVETTVKLAVLIDADNVSPAMAAPLLAEVAKFGTAFARRAYGDWTGNSLRSWKEQLLTQSIQPVQQFAYTSGKNATDSAMIIDAMDLLYTNRFDGFCLASSDSDFTRLAARIRESGLVVYGFGERKTPKPFVAACDKFTHFENILYNDEQLVAVQPSLPVVATVPTAKASTSNAFLAQRSSQAVPSLRNEAQLAKQLRMAIEAASDEEGWANLAKVGANSSLRPSCSTSTDEVQVPESQWSSTLGTSGSGVSAHSVMALEGPSPMNYGAGVCMHYGDEILVVMRVKD
ncbi:hypothetical protein HYQ46_004870 [Verticillium longisporum]|nr:hypothetical protein HYQ46_004870 [Verticillium longisporum]